MLPRKDGTAMISPRQKLRSTLRSSDVARLSVRGVAERPLRAVLSALGIAIGVAAMVSILGITASSQTALDDQVESLGTNLLRVAPGDDPLGETAELPSSAPAMIDRLSGVQVTGHVAELDGLSVGRSRYADPDETLGLQVNAAGGDLLESIGAQMRGGSWLGPTSQQFPTAVLGSTAASRLGVTQIGQQVVINRQAFTVTGVLKPVALAPELDTGVMIDVDQAAQLYNYAGSPTTIYLRANEARISAIRDLLGPTAAPQHPGQVQISRPSDALLAKNLATQTLTTVLLGLGAVALLVGGIGVANTMVISVIERQHEIGLRRALGASRSHVRLQFLTESIVLASLGGMVGVLIGVTATSIVALHAEWRPDIPAPGVSGSVVVTILVGVIAGIYPAIRASRVPPTVALQS